MLDAPFERAHTTYFRGYAELALGDKTEAIRWFQTCSRLADGTGPFMESVAMYASAEASALGGDPNAPQIFRDAIEQMHSARNWHILWLLLEVLAHHWVLTSRHRPGAVILGHLQAHGQANAAVRSDRQTAIRKLATIPGSEQWLAEGAVTDREELLSQTLMQLEIAIRDSEALPAGLTERERDVIRLLAEGLSNADIATRLFVSVRTVHAHLRSVYSKLGVSTRTAAVRRAADLHVVTLT